MFIMQKFEKNVHFLKQWKSITVERGHWQRVDRQDGAGYMQLSLSFQILSILLQYSNNKYHFDIYFKGAKEDV